MKKKENVYSFSGFSLVEILVAISVFAILATVTTSAVTTALRNSKKSESATEVKQNIDYALSILERNLQSAKAITECNVTPTTIKYTNADSVAGSFTCANLGTSTSQIASASGALNYRITNDRIRIATCSFTCSGSPNFDTVDISITASREGVTGIEGSSVTVTDKIYLRNYGRF